jgi:Protein of unknown function (DUF1573)
MILNRTARMRVPTTLATIAVIVLGAAHHSAFAQGKAKARSSAAKSASATAKRSNQQARPGTKPRKSAAIPKPTVVLHPGEVPVIKFDSSVFDFGRVRAGTPIKHDFVFTNTGNGTLEILKAKAG